MPVFNEETPASLAGTGELEPTAGTFSESLIFQPQSTLTHSITRVGFEAPFGIPPPFIYPHHLVEKVQNDALSQPADDADVLPPQPDFWTLNTELPSLIHWSPDGQASHEAPDLLYDISQLPDPLYSFPFDLSAPSLQESRSHASPQGLGREISPLRSHESVNTRVLDPSIFEGSSPEEAVLPLRLLKIDFPVHLDRDSMGEYVGSASPLANLFHFINSIQLSLEIEDLLCQCFEMSARIIRKRQAARIGRATGIFDGAGLSEASTQRSRPHSNNRMRRNNQLTQGTERKVTHYAMWGMSKGIIKVRLTSRAGTSAIGLESESQSMLSVSFMPRDEKRTTGITINFDQVQDACFRTTLSRRIKTFNVVPKDSEVIQCVSRNDLRSLQMLFDKREASPLDVDPKGFSLLSVCLLIHQILRSTHTEDLLLEQYAMYNGCSEVYLLLLQGGASTQNCDWSVLYTHTFKYHVT